MFRFENAFAFNWLWIAIGLIFTYFAFGQRIRGKLNQVIGSRLLPFLSSSSSPFRQKLKFFLQVFVVVGFIFALARPQLGTGTREIKSEGTQIVFMIDVSTSMLTQDLRPSRLEFAKKEVARLVDALGGDKVGLVAFAGSAVLLAPMTNDKNAIKMLLEGLDAQTVANQGTQFEIGLKESWETFKRSKKEDEETTATRVVIIASDGEDNEPGALATAQKMSEEGIKIFALGFGTEQGGPIPIINERSGWTNKKDKSGQEVISRFTPGALRDLANTGGGSFYHATFGNNSVDQLREDINKLKKSQFDSVMQTEYAERFQWILAFAIILALIELLLSERRPGSAIWQGRFGGTA